MLQFFSLILFCETVTIRLQQETLRVELAQTHQEQVQGLVGHPELEDDEGMLFVYKNPKILSFWMKGMRFPISIGFFDKERTLIGIEEMAPPIRGERIPKQYLSPKPALYALEMPPGWFERHQITLGAHFDWDN